LIFDDFRRWFDNGLEQDVATLLARAAQYGQLQIKSYEKSKFRYSGTPFEGSRVDQKLRFDTENAGGKSLYKSVAYEYLFIS